MAFEKQNINYADEYNAAVLFAMPYKNYFPEIFTSQESTTWKPLYGNEILRPSITVKGAKDRSRDDFGGTRTRNFNNKWNSFKLEMEREWDTTIDPLDMDETNKSLSVANITKVFNEQQMLPEMSAYAAQKMYSLASTNSTLDETAITKDNVLETWDTYIAQLQNARCDTRNVVAYATPTVLKALKNAAGIERWFDTSRDQGNVNRAPGKLDTIPVNIVPEDIMQSAFTFTDGWAKGSSAKQINLILADLTAVFAPIKMESVMTQAPSAVTANKWYVYISYYYGLGINEERKGGLIVNAASA